MSDDHVPAVVALSVPVGRRCLRPTAVLMTDDMKGPSMTHMCACIMVFPLLNRLPINELFRAGDEIFESDIFCDDETRTNTTQQEN